MTPLAEIITRRIDAEGPMPLSEYMALCLGHPEHGYYTTRDPLGREGDFTTAPEISQMFGELIGLWLAQAWADRGAPKRFILVELGPGRGTLMADALRAAAKADGFLEAAELWLVETSPALRRKQWEALSAYEPQWADNFDDVPEGPLFLIANEFFDALPIRQFITKGGALHERSIGLDEGALAFGLSPPLSAQDAGLLEAPEGTIVETCPLGRAIAQQIGERLSKDSGAALIIDYGHARSGPGETLQAMKGHEYADPLAEPGEADLTAHVDFQALASSARQGGAQAWEIVTQGALLEWLGIRLRTAMLAKRQPDQAEALNAALARLTHEDQMGQLFKALALSGDDTPPPGFAEDLGAHE